MKRYDILFTVEMSKKQYRKLSEATDVADEDCANTPLWQAGLAAVEAAVRALEDDYDVKANLVRWVFRRNQDDLRRRGE